MSDFMAELLKDKGLPNKVAAKPVSSRVDVSVETTRWNDGEKVKDVKVVKEEKKEVETKFMREKTMYLSYDLSSTINLGSFNMGKVAVSLSMPVGMEVTPELVTKLNGSYEFLKKFVETKMEQEVKELLRLRDLG